MNHKFNAEEVPVRFSELTISQTELFAALGYGNSVPDEHVVTLINAMLNEVKDVCNPQLGIRIMEGIAEHNHFVLDDKIFHPGRIILQRLRRGILFSVVLGSIGHEMDEWMKIQQNSGDIMKAYVADTIGSVVAESIIEYAKDYLRERFHDTGYNISNSYSPGYCGWDVSEQQSLFSLLPQGFCGVQLLPSSLMLPLKSISTIMAIGPDVTYEPYRCAICRKQNCYRRH